VSQTASTVGSSRPDEAAGGIDHDQARAGELRVALVRALWATPGILEAMKPGRMQGHGGTAEVPG
jgi:hypothetical protein